MPRSQSVEELINRELERRKRRALSDRMARKFIKENPGIKEDPDGYCIEPSSIPSGTTEAVIRSRARYAKKQQEIRKMIREDEKGFGESLLPERIVA